MTIEAFAKQHRLKIRLDACGDPVIYGSGRGAAERQLYFDKGELCLMILDGGLVKRGRWQELGAEPAKLWLGDISREGSQGVQDVKITGIPLTRARLAIRLARVKLKRVMSDAQAAAAAAALAKARGASRDAV